MQLGQRDVRDSGYPNVTPIAHLTWRALLPEQRPLHSHVRQTVRGRGRKREIGVRMPQLLKPPHSPPYKPVLVANVDIERISEVKESL